MPKPTQKTTKVERKAESFTLTYRGGLADEGMLNFYEFGRAQYGTARLIYSAAALRETGQVPEKITRRIGTNIVVEAPYRGSFVTHILALVGEEAVKVVVDVSIMSLLAIAFRQFKDPQKLSSEITEQAQNLLLRKPRYERLGKEGIDRVAFLEELLQKADRSYETLGKIADESALLRELAADISPKDLDVYRNLSKNAASMAELDKIISSESENLNNISETQISRLTYKIRTAAQDMGLPLRHSANNVALGGASNDNLFGIYSEGEIRDLISTKIDENAIDLLCNVIEYNKEGRFGKLRIIDNDSENKGAEFYFSASQVSGNKLHDSIIDSLKSKEVWCELKAARRAKAISRFIMTNLWDKHT